MPSPPPSGNLPEDAAEQQPTPPPERQRPFPWFWFGTFIGSAFSAVGLGLAAWGWVFIQDDLSPLISEVLSDYLERPVELGAVEGVTFGSVRVGPSTVGASEQDPTTLVADTVIVNFDLIDTLLTSELKLDLTVIDAKGSLIQDPEKGWLNFYFPEQEEPTKERRFKVDLDEIFLKESELTLVPLPVEGQEPDPILLQQLKGQLDLDKATVAEKDVRNVRFEVEGSPVEGGEITFKGEVKPVPAVPRDPDKTATDETATDEPPRKKRVLDYASKFWITADDAPIADIIGFTLSTLNLQTDTVTFDSGRVSGTMDMAFIPGEDIDYSGTISAKDTDIRTDILPLPIENAAGETQFQGNEWTIDRLVGDYGDIDVVAEGLIDFDQGYNLTATTQNVTVKEFTETVDLDLPVPASGNFDAVAQVTGPMDKPRFSGTAIADRATVVDKVTFDTARTDFVLQGNQLFLGDIYATPTSGGSLSGTGQVLLSGGAPFTFNLAGRNLPAAELAALYDLNPNFALGLVSADATVIGSNGEVTTLIDWDAPTAQYPGSGTVTVSNGTDLAFSNTVFALGGGTVSGDGSLIDGRFDSDVNFQAVQLNAFSPDLRGDVNGQFRFSGTTDDLSIGGIAASGDITFSAGVAAFSSQFDSLNSPLTAQVVWNGEKIQVVQATSDRIVASGTLTPSFDSGFTGLERLDLGISARDYAISELPFDIPDILALTGRTDVVGTLSGAPTAPNFNGNVSVTNLVANNLPFNPLLAGTVAYSPVNGLALNLAGDTDKIELNVGVTDSSSTAAIPPLDFDVNWRGAVARGETQGDILTAEAQNFPIAALNFPTDGVAEIGQLRGTLTATDVVANLSSQTLQGNIAIDQLGVGYISAGRLAGQVSYAQGLARLDTGEITLGRNLYNLTAQLNLNGAVPTYSADISTQSGNIQNLLTALSIYRLEDFRRGLTPPDWLEDPLTPDVIETLLATAATGAPTLSGQLDRLAEIQALEEDAAIAEAADPVPPLRDVDGPFAGTFQLNGSGTDFNLGFDLLGQNWEWGDDYSAQEVVAKGTLTPNVLTLEPVRFASTIAVPIAIAPEQDTPTDSSLDDTAVVVNPEENDDGFPEIFAVQPVDAFINLAGQVVFGKDTELTSTLQATIDNINVASIRDILQIPIDINGLANARATLGGTLSNPQLRGFGGLTTATINNTPIETAEARFLYQNARLALLSSLTADTPEQPLTLTADIPYAFEFMDIEPDGEDIDININVQNEGLALLNIFTDQVAWDSGEGEINLLVGGTLADPVISGNAFLNEAVLTAQVLPEPLTNVVGNATFVRDQIVIESLSGQFSDGQLTAAGIFPLVDPVVTGGQLSTFTPVNAVAPDANTQLPTETPPAEISPAETSPAGIPAEESNGATADPLFPRQLSANLPLTANLENINLTLEDLYQGNVNGQIIVGGSALEDGPQIGGQVVLSNGQILLSDNSDSEGNSPGENGAEGSAIANSDTDLSRSPIDAQFTRQRLTQTEEDSGITPIFRDLELTLGNNIRIVQGTLLNFVADGSLLLNGPPSDLEPDGIIRVRSGRVNLFTTTFRLRGRDNFAQFTPETGLQNPFLDISLRAAVPEVDSSGLLTSNTPFGRSETADTSNNGFDNPGSLRTLRVRADVQGPADAIFDNLELSSSPPRSQSELIGLIGGGFVTALESTVGSLSGGGDGFEGLINLVSGALLNNIQDVIGNTLSLSEFRLFPVTSASRAQSEDGGDDDTGLDFAAEAGFDLTEDTSVSVLKILTDSSNPEFGLNYRLTDSLTVRANSNLDDINQVLLEYEIRF